MSGCTAHGRLERNARKIGDGVVRGKLYHLGGFPGLIRGEGEVHGEVYEVNPETVAVLDAYEGYTSAAPDKSLYVRDKTTVKMADGNVVRKVHVYYYNRPISPDRVEIATGKWRDCLDEKGIPRNPPRY